MAKKKPKQQQFEEMKDPTIPEIEKAAENYVRDRDARMEMTKDEAKSHDVLMAAMKKHDLLSYRFGNKLINVVQGATKVKVKRSGDEEDGDDDDAE